MNLNRNRKLLVWVTALFVLAAHAESTTSQPTQTKVNGQKEISEMNLLIPVSLCSSTSPTDCRSAKHELFAYNGCYQWTISHPHIIEMTPGKQRGDCVDSVILRSQLKRESKTIVWITAKDKSSGQVLETQAKIGIIDRLAININYKHLYINDKKHIDVVAYDDEGNIFSGLDGFLFDWSIASGVDFIKVIKRPEGYSHKRSIDGTDVAFVKGLKPGASEITVKILEPGYEGIKPVSVTILVVDPFVINPAHKIYMLPSSRFDYSLQRLKKQDDGTVDQEKIVIPNKQYFWSVLNEGYGTIKQDGAFISGVLETTQTLLVIDQKMVNNTAEADLQIVYPYRLEMSIHDVTSIVPTSAPTLAQQYNVVHRPSQSKILVENHTYLILLSLFDKDGNRITLTDNVNLGNTNLLDSSVIEKVSTNKIGSEILFKTRSIVKIVKLQTQFFLQEIKNIGEAYQFQRSTQLTVDAELVLTKPVQIMHPTNLILLPFIENGQVYHTHAIGGSGVYEWTIQDSEIASIESSVSIKSLKVGKTRLTVNDLKNQNNRAFVDVEVASVAQLKQLEEHMELFVGGEISTVNVIGLDSQQRKFTNCTSLDVKFVNKGEGVIFTDQSLNHNNITTWVQQELSLIRLKQRFDENPNTIDVTDLPKSATIPDEILTHNNFGICAQSSVQANVEGLARVQTVFTAQNKAIVSEYAEIAVYKKLETAEPQVASYVQDLYSISQIGNEFTTFTQFTSNVISLVPGSEIIWSVTGGTNFWKDYSDKYSVTWTATPTEGTNCLQIAKHSEQTTVQNIKIRCNSQDISAVNKLTVTMQQSSKLSRQLLRPAQHSLSINLECSAPKSTRLLWAQQSQKVVAYLPNSKLQHDERIHYVLVGSKHYIKSVFFNQAQLSFFNSSSIVNKVTSSDLTLATVIPIAATFEEAVLQNCYAKKIVQFTNKTGTVVLKSSQSAYINTLLHPAPSILFSPPKDTSEWNLGELTTMTTSLIDQMKIQVVNNVGVSPPFKSIYLGSESIFSFVILEGSGHFTISLSDNDIAHVVHKEREILVTPKSAGLLVIRIEDVQLPGGELTIAQLLVSDIDKLHLWAPSTLMEQGDQMQLVVNAFDSQGNNFDEDQYPNMMFGIETEMTGVIRKHGLKTEITPSNVEFKAFGNEPGIYQLTAYTLKVNSAINVVSEMIRVEVFPILEIVPNSLLITPNMKYTLQIFGGPQTSVQAFQNGSSIEVKFEIDQTGIASVDQNREVTGIQVGDATLRYTIIQQRTHKGYIPRSVNQNDWLESRIVSKKSVPIRVRLVTDIELPLVNQRQIYIGSLVKLNVVLKHENEYFNHGIAPISYAWNCSSQRVLTLELPNDVSKQRKLRNNLKNDDNAPFLTTFNSSSVYATASKEGDAQLTVLLAIEYPQQYNNQKNWFTQQATVKVAQKLKIQVNEFSTQSSDGTHMYLIPPNSIGHISTNIDTKLKLGYSVVSVYDHSTNSYRSEDSTSPLVKLIDNKAIQTFEKYGKVTVVVEQGGSQFSDQVAMLNVFISDIYSLQVMNTYDTLNLPLGSNYKLPIHFQNEHALRFANNVEGIQIGYSVSHPKVVTVSLDEFSQTLNINSQGSGDCNIFVYLVNRPQIFDIIKVKVSSIVRPYSPVFLHVGGEVEFKVINPDDSKDDIVQGATWKSSEPGVLQIDSTNGKALAKGEGKADVMLSNHINAASIVHVSRIQFGQVEQKNGLILNTDEVSLQGSKYQAPDDLKVRIKMFLSKNGEEVMPTVQFDGVTLIKQNVGIHCATDQPDFVIATGEVSDLEGFFCVLRYKQDANHKSMPRYVKVTVNAYSLLPSSVTPLYSDQIAQFEVQLLSSIKVEKSFMNGVQLSKMQRSQSIQIFSSSDFNTQIEYVTKDDSVMLKQQVTRSNLNSNDYNLTVIVPSDVTRNFQANIILTHPYTKFQRVIPVSFDYRDDQPKPKTKASSKQEPEFENMRVIRSERSWSSYLAYILVGVATVVFIIHNWFNVNVLGWLGYERPQQRPQRNRPAEMHQPIREPRSYPVKNPSYVDSSFLNDRSNQSQAYQDRRPRQIPTSANLDRVQSRSPFLDRSGGDPSQRSLFHSSSSRF